MTNKKKAKLARIRHLFHIKREKEAERKRILKRAIKRAFLAYRNKGFYIGPCQARVTALTAAIVAKDQKSVEALLDGGADPNEVDEFGRNTLFWAARKGCRLDLFQRILDKIDNVNVCDIWNTALMEAVSHNYLDFVTALMNHPDIDVNAQNSIKETALHLAVSHNYLDLVTALMNHSDIDVNAQNEFKDTALHLAVKENHTAIVAQLLSDDRIDCSLTNKRDRTPLMIAIKYGNGECERIIREHGSPEPSLDWLKANGDEDDFFGGLDDYVYRSSRPLNAALEEKDEDKANVLLDSGDNPNKKDDRYYNALHIAARKGCGIGLFHKILSKMKKSQVNEGMYRDNGYTALMFAVVNNHLDLVTALMQNPFIDPNVQNHEKETALHLAVYHNHPAIVEQLVSNNRIDTSLRDITTVTPLRIAIKWKRDECVKILRNHGALI